MSEERFEQGYYDSVYPNYARQNPPKKLRFYREMVERVAPVRAPVRVLDIGCAFGAFLSALDPRWERYGTDVSRYAVEKATAALPDVRFARADIDAIPFPGPFDVVTSFDVIEHIPSLDAVASAVESRLASGGHFVFVVPVYDGVTGPLIHLLDKDETHVHKRSRDFWLEWAGERFALVAWCGIFRYLIPGLGYAHIPTRRLRRFTPAIAVTARRKA
ncbi:MAG TPA: class I SAM-dependent methyltransferase [Candidatus Eisenbacteria bacterium]|nr:class I SAM-dependent methyltransferase [Candidatus Eisenbacteria bacterium]